MRTPMRCSWVGDLGYALFIDLPYVLDSAIRRLDYQLNKRYSLVRGHAGLEWQRRWPFISLLPLGLCLIFAMYGPTFDALCSILPAVSSRRVLWAVAAVVSLAAGRLVYLGARFLRKRYWKRIDKLAIAGPVPRVRKAVLGLSLSVLAIVPPGAPVGLLVWRIVHSARDIHTCQYTTPHAQSWLQLAFTIVLVAAAARLGMRPRSRFWRVADYLILLSAPVVILAFLGGCSATEAQYMPYLNAFAVLCVILVTLASAFAALFARFVRRLESDYASTLAEALKHCELFEKRGEVTLGWGRLLYAFLGAPLAHPLLLLLLPSFVAMVAPRHWLWNASLIALAITWFVLALGNISMRWDWQIALVRRWLLVGTPLCLSVAAVGLAIARLVDVSYVSYVLDAAPLGVVSIGLAMLYALAWLLESALHRPLQAELLALLECNDEKREKIRSEEVDRVDYSIEPDNVRTDVLAEERYIQVHGAGRFAVVGVLAEGVPGRAEEPEAFQTYDTVELIRLLIDSERRSSRPQAPKDENAIIDLVHTLVRGARNYFAALDVVLLVVVGAMALAVRSADTGYTRNPLVKTKTVAAASSKGFDLLSGLQSQASKGRPAILLSASGGGTRAAMFTASALRGLAATEHANDIVLMSGVSGGGVALAYFAAHRERLVDASEPGHGVAAWCDYIDAMAFPYINDVLEGSSELRLLRDEALGRLLAESLERSFGREREASAGQSPSHAHVTRRTFGEVLDVGLILNTTIAAHPYADSHLLTTLFASGNGADALAYEQFRGGRLIFTNLANGDFFPPGSGASVVGEPAPDIQLTYKVIRDTEIPLTSAAALNANFPPVFSNIGVWEGEKPRKYYVTDGGVNENRGLVSLLFALDGALEEEEGKECKDRSKLPKMEIVALEASAMTFDYAQDRGLGAVFSGGSAERLASGLERRLFHSIGEHVKHWNEACGGEASLGVHYVTMPTLFTARGGFGTHWLLPETVRVHSPREPERSFFEEYRDIDAGQVTRLVECMFQTAPADGESCRDGAATTPIPDDWLSDAEPCNSSSGVKLCAAGWPRLRESLGMKNDAPVASLGALLSCTAGAK